MRVHRVQKGECFASIATRYGFSSWRKLYDHPSNRALRERRPNPNLLAPGDEVAIPEARPLARRVATNTTQTITLKTEPTLLRLKIPEEGEFRYQIRLEGSVIVGDIVAPGVIEHEVPLGARTAEFTIWPHRFERPEHAGREATIWSLSIGALRPADDVRGVQARLVNLGYFNGREDGQLTPETVAALRAFQEEEGLDVTGNCDQATRAALVSRFGC
jgi:N-acetylmuramoyl-L-alanine amidase